MPFKSNAQRKWMYANEPEIAKKWSEHTPKGAKLPEHVKHKKAHMNTQEQAYINGFLKRASEYGLSEEQAIAIYKQAMVEPSLMGKKTPMKPTTPAKPVLPKKPMIPNEADQNDVAGYR